MMWDLRLHFRYFVYFTAAILLRIINPSYDPCENFQKFLCGTYEQNIGPYDNGSIVVDMTERMMIKLKSK